MPVTQKAVFNALRQVMNPEAGKSLVDLGLVRDIGVKEDHVEVILALDAVGLPLRDRLVDEARAAVSQLPGGN